jgi:flagellar hook protein FlgE
MTTSFYNGITGLKAFQNGIDVWGNNIANIDTAGYKETLPEFSTVFSDTLNSTPSVNSDIGFGSVMSANSLDLQEGSLVHTDNPFDLAIGGKGWFAVSKNNSTYYTRTGTFTRDADGYLVDGNGDYLLVANAGNLTKNPDGTYSVNRDINTDDLVDTTAQMTPISLPNNVILPAIPTKNITLTTNLNTSDKISSTSPAVESSDFSALYSKDGEDLKIRNGDSLVFGFGNPATYSNNLISTDICINSDPKDGKDAVYNFTLNGKTFNIDMPDGSSKEEIQNALKKAFDNAGISSKITADGIEISDPEQIILKSNNTLMPNIAAAKISYSSDPQNQYEFSTIDDFDKIVQSLANDAYPDKTKVYLDSEGRICIDNSSNQTLNAYTLKTETSNSAFMDNLGRLGNQIYPQTSAKSYAFLTNTQNFGGYLFDSDGNKDTLSFGFTKQKTLSNQTLWNCTVTVKDPDSKTITQKDVQLTFDKDGKLIDPESVTLTQPQDLNIKLNVTSYAKTDSANSYSFTQDGVDKGYLKKYQIDADGNIQATFSNGKMSVLGQIPVYHFQNDQGLESIGGNLFAQTANSNSAILYKNTENKYIPGASIQSGTIEESNVNMSQAMTELIVIQKAFSSAAKTVTTSDQMIQRAIDMKKG